MNPFRTRRIRTLDLVAAWVMAWVGMRIYVGRDIREFAQMPRTAASSGASSKAVPNDGQEHPRFHTLRTAQGMADM
jgi:hypothetical protein